MLENEKESICDASSDRKCIDATENSTRPNTLPEAQPLSETSIPVAAKWDVKEPQDPWCPPELSPHLPFFGKFCYQHNYSLQSESFAGWRLIAATRRGKKHAHDAQYREDAFGFICEEDFIVAAVSDGAGSYKHSRIGSEATCREVCRRLKMVIDENRPTLSDMEQMALDHEIGKAIVDAVAGTCQFLRDVASKSGCDPKDLRCTLLVLVFVRTPKATSILSSQVGDGFFAELVQNGTSIRLGYSDSGDFSGEVNCFVPDADASAKAAKLIAIKESGSEAFAICTDGIEDPFYPIEKHAGLIFQQFYNGIPTPLSLLAFQASQGSIIDDSAPAKSLEQWLSFEKRGENDDRTILILHRCPPTVDKSMIGR